MFEIIITIESRHGKTLVRRTVDDWTLRKLRNIHGFNNVIIAKEYLT